MGVERTRILCYFHAVVNTASVYPTDELSAVTEQRISITTHLRNNYFCGARIERFSLRIKHLKNENCTGAVAEKYFAVMILGFSPLWRLMKLKQAALRYYPFKCF